MDVYNSIFEANFHKINLNSRNLPETFWVDKFKAYFYENFHRLSAFVEIYQEFPNLMFFKFANHTILRQF